MAAPSRRRRPGGSRRSVASSLASTHGGRCARCTATCSRPPVARCPPCERRFGSSQRRGARRLRNEERSAARRGALPRSRAALAMKCTDSVRPAPLSRLLDRLGARLAPHLCTTTPWRTSCWMSLRRSRCSELRVSGTTPSSVTKSPASPSRGIQARRQWNAEVGEVACVGPWRTAALLELGKIGDGICAVHGGADRNPRGSGL